MPTAGRETSTDVRCDAAAPHEPAAVQCESAVRRELALLPMVGEWPDLDVWERERRARILDDIARRIREDGPRVAVPADERGRQFLPFAALNGFDDMVAETERRANERE